MLRGYTELRYGAKTWKTKRRVSARIEASTLGLDIRYLVTNITDGSAEWLYDTLYCARGQAENRKRREQLARFDTGQRFANGITYLFASP